MGKILHNNHSIICHMLGASHTRGKRPYRLAGLRIAATLVVLGLGVSPAMAQTSGELRQLGLSLRDQERYSEAIAALQKSVDLEPENLSGRVLLGWTQHKAGQQADAAKTLVDAFYLNPFDVPTLNALGIVYLVDGQLQSAIVAHSWAAMLKPNNEIAHYNLSLAFERIQQYDWAIATAKEAAKLEPSNPHPLVALAIAHQGNQEQSEAQNAFRQAIAIDSRYADSSFLNYLDEAGFSPKQIEESKQILSRLP